MPQAKKITRIENIPTVAAAFNCWLDEYENHPERFEHEWATIRQHLKEKAEGVEPTYGEECVAVLNSYIDKIAAKEAVTDAV